MDRAPRAKNFYLLGETILPVNRDKASKELNDSEKAELCTFLRRCRIGGVQKALMMPRWKGEDEEEEDMRKK